MNDTLCEPCKPGTFRTADSASQSCLPCSTCADEEDVVTKCTASQDTICRTKPGNFHLHLSKPVFVVSNQVHH